ncbi:MAG: hypothetical protein LEGION0403_FIIPPAGN_02770 [Legionella sp.]|uniref:hypothetical protein n=1 Tax=Legionella sp. TaxID=459 RepID=UPI003D125B63
MFTWLNKQGVKSDKGFVVQSIGRFVIKYSENIGDIDVTVEDGFKDGKHFVYIYNKEFYEWKDGRKISEEKKTQILNNFIDALAFMGIGVEVQ